MMDTVEEIRPAGRRKAQSDRLRDQRALEAQLEPEHLRDLLVLLDDLPDTSRHSLIQKGLATHLLQEALQEFQTLDRAALLKAIQVNAKTIERNRKGRLQPMHSDAALALMEVTRMAERILGNRRLAERWLSEPVRGLDYQRPIDLLTTSAGIEAVKTLLVRMEYGVYA
ncbi:MAG TPA: DUF2384 domain-containing protein [Rhodocyclaceae bacterium]|jgi:putative toxin-antitoxin system antitoxin component (TIGR02293 family)|nr:DUF2384 domain-containing protein [Rhodocyclaceae bacterium]HRQ47823.1 DUF2384 domain-containing protein [Rhodocyclaceae bacterium]